jgi:hypothetical protein
VSRYVYVASSWRNTIYPKVIAALSKADIDHYDFRNPAGGTGFSWKEVTPPDAETTVLCEHCGKKIAYSTFAGLGFWEPDFDPGRDPQSWRHISNGYASCFFDGTFAAPAKGSDLVPITTYLKMLEHPRAIEGFTADFDAMHRADTFVLVLPCGRSAHLELGWAVGQGKRTAILLEDPSEPELMYRMVEHLARSISDLVRWAGES